MPENTPLAEEPPNKRARKGASAAGAREQQRQGQGRAELVPGKGQEQAAAKGEDEGRWLGREHVKSTVSFQGRRLQGVQHYPARDSFLGRWYRIWLLNPLRLRYSGITALHEWEDEVAARGMMVWGNGHA